MITVVILAIIVTVAIPAYNGYVTRGKITEATSGLSGLRVQMEQYFQDNRSYVTAGGACGAAMPAAPAVKYFTFTCAGTQTTYTITATGTSGGMAGFAYTVDQANNKASTITAPATTAGWSAANPNNCWITNKGGTC